MKRLDAIIVAADGPQEFLGKDVREKVRLTVKGVPASIPFLTSYFRSGRNIRQAMEETRAQEASFLSLNGPHLQQLLTAHGFEAAVVPMLATGRDRFRELALRNPRAIVISTTFLPFASQIDAIAAWAKQHAPGALVVAGGIQVWKSYQHRRLLDAGSITPDIAAAMAEHNYLVDIRRPSPVDALVISHRGEHTLLAILDALRAGRDARHLANTAWYEGDAWRINPLDEEPVHEARVDWNAYLGTPTAAYVPVQAGTGCNSRCTFCDFRGLRPVQSRSVDSIMAEIGSIPPHNGIRRVFFTDDNLFANSARVRDLCGALIRAKLNVRWRGLLRMSLVTDETASLMAESGCLEALLGVESGDGDMLKRMNKSMTPDRILEGVRSLSRCGIHTKSTFIVGFPGETEASVRNTVALLNAYPTNLPAAHRYLFFTYAVLPLSEVAQPESRHSHRLRGYGYHWEHATMDSATAARLMAAAQDMIKPEVSPNYVLEVPEAEGLTGEAIRDVYRLRTEIARIKNGLTTGNDETLLWRELEACFIR